MSLNRIIALVVIPALVVDPAFSVMCERPSSANIVSSSILKTHFSLEAVNPWLELAHRTLTGRRSAGFQTELGGLTTDHRQ